ncbi:LuxR C-terminal-related transcriptional regulator [Patulibacter minatonensis]|uniref:LuxR C-terminal-related transcriptional regulator n=1 Tax=Patulibacter minatonensis TaxID=298163 RepID=UPI0006878652|nr:LuxR C-terminal-related transcriptional regulator [Patulibacter minatonensis]
MIDAGTLGERAEHVLERARRVRDDAGRDGVATASDLADALYDATSDLQDALRERGTRDAATTMRLCGLLVELTRIQGDLRDQVVAARFGTVARIHESHSRLRDAGTLAELLPAAAAELGRSCGFDRAAISRRHGSRWHAEAVWLAPGTDAGIAQATRDYLTQKWIPLRPGTVESHLVQRRSAALVSADDPDVDRALVDDSAGGRYVASPVMSGDRVVGFLHADRFGQERVVTEIDRDNLWTFGEGFGLVFERLALLERLDGQRARVREAFAAAEQGLAELGRDELLLSRSEAPAAMAGARAVGRAADRAGQVLTPREREVVDEMATGARNREIAERLMIGEATVKSHVRTIARKLGASSRADAVARYLRLASEGPA